jgi:hypothetical protein
MTARALLVLTACFPLLIAASPAAATPSSPLQAEVERLLDLTPGGTQLDDHTISWEDGQVIVTVAVPTEIVARAIASCPTGYYCAWTAPGFSGSSIWLASCTVGGSAHSLAPLGGVARSFANARTSGTVTVKNGSSVVDTLTPSSGRSSVTYASTAMVCFT